MSGHLSDTAARPLDYARTPARKNTAAAVALLFGMMPFVPLIAGVLAIGFGRRGLRDARDYALGRATMARLGLILGVINLLAWIVFAVGWALHAREQAIRASCREHLRLLGRAVLMYSDDNRGQPPPSLDHLVTAKYMSPGDSAFTCPACAGNAAGNRASVGQLVQSDYLVAGPWNPLPPPEEMRLMGAMPYFVVAWEPPSNHGGRGINVVFLHRIEWFDGAVARNIDAELRAGLNPPPSIDSWAAHAVRMAATRRAAATTTASEQP